MAIFIDPKKELTYVLKEQQELPKEEQITFKFKILTARDYAALQNAIQGKDGEGRYETKWGSYTFEMLKRGLSGWEGPGVPKFKTDDEGLVTDECIDLLSAVIRSELASQIDRANSMSEEDRGN